MDGIEPSRREYVRTQRRKLTAGMWIPFAFGVLTFCLVAPLLALLNLDVPHLPWIPKDHPVEPAIQTAWLCARFVTSMMLVMWVVMFIFVPKIRWRPRRKV